MRGIVALRSLVLFAALALLAPAAAVTQGSCAVTAEGSFLARLAPHAHYAGFLQYDTATSSFVTDGTANGFYGVGSINRMLIQGRELYFAGNFQYVANGLQSNTVARANLDSYILGAMDEGVWNEDYLPSATAAANATLPTIFLQKWKGYIVVAGHISVPALGTGERTLLALYDTALCSWRQFPTTQGLCPDLVDCRVLGLAADGEELFVAVQHEAEASVFQTHLLSFNEDEGTWQEAGPVPTPGLEHDRGNIVRIAYDSLVVSGGNLFALGYASSTDNPDPFANYAQFYVLSWSLADLSAVPAYTSLWLRVCAGAHRSVPALAAWHDGTALAVHPRATCQGTLTFQAFDGRLTVQSSAPVDDLESLGSAPLLVAESESELVAVSDGTWTYLWSSGQWTAVDWARAGDVRALAYEQSSGELYASFTDATDAGASQAVQKYPVRDRRPSGQPFFVDSVYKNGAVTSALAHDHGLMVGGDFRFAGTTTASIAALYENGAWERTTQSATGFEGQVATALAGDGSAVFGLVFDKRSAYGPGSRVPSVLWTEESSYEYLPHRPTWTPDDGTTAMRPETFADLLYDAPRQRLYIAGDFVVQLHDGSTARGLMVFDMVEMAWSTLEGAAFADVQALALFNNGMYLAIGGTFDAEVAGERCTNLAAYDLLNRSWANHAVAVAAGRTTAVLALAAYPSSTKLIVAGTLPSNNGEDYGVGVLDYAANTWQLDGSLAAPAHAVVAPGDGSVFVATAEQRPLLYQATLFHDWLPLVPEAEGVFWKGHVSRLGLWCATAAPSPSPSPSRSMQPSRPASAGSSWVAPASIYDYQLPGSSYWTNCTDPSVNGTGHYYRCHQEGPTELSVLAIVGLIVAAAATVLFVGIVLVFVYLRKKEEARDDDDDFQL